MRVTENQIKKLIHQSNLIEGYDSEIMDLQGLKAWRFLQKLDVQSLSHYDIQKVQRIVVASQDDLQPRWRGQYRSSNGVNVTIAGRPGMKPELIDHAMDNWIQFVKIGINPHTSHVEFENIHPFVDGNGRTGRLLMWWYQTKRDEPLTKITYVDRAKYYDWFK